MPTHSQNFVRKLSSRSHSLGLHQRYHVICFFSSHSVTGDSITITDEIVNGISSNKNLRSRGLQVLIHALKWCSKFSSISFRRHRK
jgi:hypothetical protein